MTYWNNEKFPSHYNAEAVPALVSPNVLLYANLSVKSKL